MLNPTGGVKGKQPVILDYKQDPSRAGGGIFVAQSQVPELKDVPKGVVIRKSEVDIGDSKGEDSSPAASTAAVSSVSLLASNNNNDQVRAAFPSSRTGSSASRAVSKTTRQRALPPDAFEQSMFTVTSPVVNYAGSFVAPPPLTGGHEAGVVSNPATMVKVTPLTAAGMSSKMNVNPVMNQTESSSGNVQVMNVLDEVASGTSLVNFQMADDGFLEGLPGGMFDWGMFSSFISYHIDQHPL